VVALALLAFGEAAPGASLVRVAIEAHGASLTVEVDGATHHLDSGLSGRWLGVLTQSPGPTEREYQVDGSDTTSSADRDPAFITRLLETPLYRVDAWLRDEPSYSRWEHVRVTDLETGQLVGERWLPANFGVFAAEGPQPQPLSIRAGGEGPLPASFRLEAELRRPEAPARLWLLGAAEPSREGLELDRDRRNAWWLIQGPGGDERALPRWFFPEQPLPFAAELAHLVGRAAAAGYAIALLAYGIGRAVPARLGRRVRVALGRAARAGLRRAASAALGRPGRVGAARGGGQSGIGHATVADVGESVAADAGGPVPAGPGVVTPVRRLARPVTLGWGADGLVLVVWLVAAALVAWRLYHQLPHILDAVSYDFQSALLSTGVIALPLPPLVDAFRGPFEVIFQGRWFSQYPPGAPAAYALGRLVGLDWLVGPLAGLVLLAATGWTSSVLFGRGVGRATLVLGVLSPFVLFQAGSFLSHPIAGAVLAVALATFVAAERSTERQATATEVQVWPSAAGEARRRAAADTRRPGETRRPGAWTAAPLGPDLGYLACGFFLGAAFLVREPATVLFALPLGIRLLRLGRWRPLGLLLAAGLAWLLVYLAYNMALTGNPLLLPRAIFDPTDRFGFGDSLGFHQRHTFAAGLANTDELLTLLDLDLFGWPPLFGLGLLGLPFLLGRVQAWDSVAAEGALAFVVAYTAYFYHGIALGPRYYYEALPWLLLLAGRGVQTLVELARGAWLGPVLLLALLCANSVLFYLPAELARRADYAALPDGRRLVLSFVQPSAGGPRLVGLPERGLVLTDDWWTYNAALAPLNCPRVPECGVLFALATSDEDVQQLEAAYPGRTVLRAVDRGGTLSLEPSR
jgi:hypothetical protein